MSKERRTNRAFQRFIPRILYADVLDLPRILRRVLGMR